MNKKNEFFSLFLMLSLLVSCGKSSSEKSNRNQNEQKPKDEYVDLKSVPSEFNLRELETGFNISDIKKIKINLFGFDENFEVIYSKNLAPDTGLIKVYTVSKNSRYSLGNFDISMKDTDLNINEYGSFQCSITVTNKQIQTLDGSCYLKIEVILPEKLEAEVYNVGNLESKAFFAISNEEFIVEFEKCSFESCKLEVIGKFKESYRVTGKKILLSAEILGRVISDFTFKKFEMLKDLHSYVQDRNNLEKVINDNFNHFDREEARKIVGI